MLQKLSGIYSSLNGLLNTIPDIYTQQCIFNKYLVIRLPLSFNENSMSHCFLLRNPRTQYFKERRKLCKDICQNYHYLAW